MTNAFGAPIPDTGGSNDTWADEYKAVLVADENNTQRLQGTMVINSPVNSQAEYLLFHARFPFDVKRVAYQCLPSGTATLAVKINTTDIGGLAALSATASKQTTDASSALSVVAGDYITVTPTSTAPAVERIVISVWGDRTGAGTAV